MMIEFVERRFGSVRAPHCLEWLTDNGSVYAAGKTVEIALALGLTPCRRARLPRSRALGKCGLLSGDYDLRTPGEQRNG